VRHASLSDIEDAGRWALISPGNLAEKPRADRATSTIAAAFEARDEAVEHAARSLLRRYGVVCWRLLAREASWLPPWRELVRVYRRLEARGELRGGRFIAGLSGEQYALPEAIPLLRKLRSREPDGSLVSIAATDVFNLAGILTAGSRVPAVRGSRILFVDGVPRAALMAGKCVRLDGSDDAIPAAWRHALIRMRADRDAPGDTSVAKLTGWQPEVA
jgi:ATP-dependent Lhr-like helicase